MVNMKIMAGQHQLQSREGKEAVDVKLYKRVISVPLFRLYMRCFVAKQRFFTFLIGVEHMKEIQSSCIIVRLYMRYFVALHTFLIGVECMLEVVFAE